MRNFWDISSFGFISKDYLSVERQLSSRFKEPSDEHHYPSSISKKLWNKICHLNLVSGQQHLKVFRSPASPERGRGYPVYCKFSPASPVVSRERERFFPRRSSPASQERKNGFPTPEHLSNLSILFGDIKNLGSGFPLESDFPSFPQKNSKFSTHTWSSPASPASRELLTSLFSFQKPR